MKMDVGRFEVALVRSGMNVSSLAGKIGVKPGTLVGFKFNKRNNPSTIIKIAAALNVDPGWLIGGDSVPPLPATSAFKEGSV